jgi:hypothetical protein
MDGHDGLAPAGAPDDDVRSALTNLSTVPTLNDAHHVTTRH